MGKPILAPSAIPVIAERKGARDTAPVVDYPLTVSKMKLRITCVSIGNPHAVCFLDQPVADFPLAEVGPKVEQHPMFPNRVNFEIVNVISRSKLRARVWERGAGETLSCGTGACAIAVTAKLKKLTDNPVDIILPGGTLTVDWDGRGEVLLSGPAEVVFEGKWKD
jgi:diaminopimelate epimerase